MARFGFCGGSYTSISPIFDAERTVNFIPENIESANGKTAMGMFNTPGASAFASVADIPGRQLHAIRANGHERLFFAGGTYLWEIFSDGTSKRIGAIGADGQPVFMCNTQIEMALTAGRRLFTLALDGNKFGESILTGDVAQVQATDAYFIALLIDSQKFQISDLLDGKSWNAIDIAQVSVFPDDVLSMLVDHREIFLFGSKQTIPYYDSGNPDFPFEPVLNGFAEDGTLAPASPRKLDNGVFWLAASDRGGGVVKRLQGYTPSRVSTHALEQLWQTYARMDDAIGYTYELNGHSFYCLRFPTALSIPGTNQYSSATHVYDVSTGLWHDWTYWDQTNGIETAHRSQGHAYCFGKHFVANPVTGNVDQIAMPRFSGGAWSFVDDNGTQIKRIRRSPYVVNEKERVFFPKFELDMECGLATVQDPDGTYRAPKAMLRWSDDGTKSWSNEHWRDIGRQGEYSKRVRWLRAGQSRNRVFELTFTDRAPIRIADAYVPPVAERLSSKLRAQA